MEAVIMQSLSDLILIGIKDIQQFWFLIWMVSQTNITHYTDWRFLIQVEKRELQLCRRQI